MNENNWDTVSKVTVWNGPYVQLCTKKFQPPSAKVDYTISVVWVNPLWLAIIMAGRGHNCFGGTLILPPFYPPISFSHPPSPGPNQRGHDDQQPLLPPPRPNNHRVARVLLSAYPTDPETCWKDLKCVCPVRSGPVWSVPIEFPRKCISVNPRNCTYVFPRRLPMSSHVGELV